MKRATHLLCALASASALIGCGSAAGGGADDVADTLADTGQDTTPPPVDPWTISIVISGQAGRELQAAVLPDGTPVVAAYADAGQAAGPCDPADASVGERVTWTLSYAVPDGDAWRVEPVAEVLHLGPPRGFDLAVGPDGAPHVAALTGEPATQPPYCGANDLALYSRGADGTWSPEVAVAESDQALTGEPASDFGTVVGLWPALAYDPGGSPFIAYRDVHGGGLQADDFSRADLEAAWRDGGGWRHLALDWGKGAGQYNTVVFDDQGRPVVLQYNPRDDLVDSERGLWVMRSSDDGQRWDRLRLYAGGTGERPSMAVDPSDGTVWVAWYDAELGLPYVARLVDPGRFSDKDGGWEISEIGDHVYDEGRYPSLAVSASGTVAVAYQRCGRASDGVGDCNPARDAVVFAWRDGPVWEREVVQDEPDGLCGNFAGLVFSGEAPVVFYQCLVQRGDAFVSELRAARREAL